MTNNPKSYLLQFLKEHFCVNDLAGSGNQNIWIMVAAVTSHPEAPLQTSLATKDNPTHIVRTVLRTTDGDGMNPYVDGTDIFIIMNDETQTVTFAREEL